MYFHLHCSPFYIKCYLNFFYFIFQVMLRIVNMPKILDKKKLKGKQRLNGSFSLILVKRKTRAFAPAIFCSSNLVLQRRRKRRGFLNRHPQRNQKKATTSPSTGSSSTTPSLSKIYIPFFVVIFEFAWFVKSIFLVCVRFFC